MTDDLEAETLGFRTQEDPVPGRKVVRRVPGLTILWHTDVRRVGEIAALTEPDVSISRAEPGFAAPADLSAKRPLGDPYLSRSPSLQVAIIERGGVELRPGAAGNEVEVNGVPLTGSRSFSWKEVETGIAITFGRRAALCLHLVEVPIARGPAMGLVGSSDQMENVRRLVRQIADLEVPVLIRGETGTGKELVARAIFETSRRASGPFVALNMSAVPASTAPAELFGYERGAFTGAAGEKPGCFVEADGGTLFLDEVGLTPLDVQKMLLRAVEAGEIRPLGARKGRRVNVRFLAATDAKLEPAMAAGTFSDAFFHRLSVFSIETPPLRARRQDIGSLLLHFLRERLTETGELGRLDPEANADRLWLSPSIVARMALFSWPGNVREFRNVAGRIAIESRGEDEARMDPIDESLIQGKQVADTQTGDDPSAGMAPAVPRPLTAPKSRVDPAPGKNLAINRPASPGSPPAPGRDASGPSDITPEQLVEALQHNAWRPGAAAAALGISRNSLYHLMKKHPHIRTAGSIPDPELLRLYREVDGDVERLSQDLHISLRALQLRIQQLLGSGNKP